MNGLSTLWKVEVWWIRISSWQYNQITIARSTHSCSMLVDSGNIVIFILSFLYFFAVNLIHFWLLDASIVLGIGIPTDYLQVKSLAKLAFRCFNWEGKIFYTPENQTYGTSKCTHEKKNGNIYIYIYKPWFLVFKVNFAGMSTFCSLAFLMPFRYTISLCFWTEAYGRCCLWTRRTQRSVTLRITFSLWEQGLYHLVAGAVLQLPCEHMWRRNKTVSHRILLFGYGWLIRTWDLACSFWKHKF